MIAKPLAPFPGARVKPFVIMGAGRRFGTGSVLTLQVRCAIDTDQVLRDQRHCGEGSGRARE